MKRHEITGFEDYTNDGLAARLDGIAQISLTPYNQGALREAGYRLRERDEKPREVKSEGYDKVVFNAYGEDTKGSPEKEAAFIEAIAGQQRIIDKVRETVALLERMEVLMERVFGNAN